jgi:hypothetical protein
VKAARRNRVRRRSALPPSPDSLERRLARIEEKLGAFEAETFVQFEGEAPLNCSPNGTRSAPIAGDRLIWFESLHDQGEDKLTPEEYRAKHCRNDIRPPPNVTLPTKPLLRDPDPELEQLAEERKTPDIRPLTDAELRHVASGLLKTGNLSSRPAARSALAGGEVPLGDESFPRAEFATSTAGTLLIRTWTHAVDHARPRAATEEDRTRWRAAFARFLAQVSPLFRTPDDERSE